MGKGKGERQERKGISWRGSSGSRIRVLELARRQPLRDAYRRPRAAGQLICARGAAFPTAAATTKYGEQVRADGNTNNNGPAATLVAAVLTDAAAGRLAEPPRDDPRAPRVSHLGGARAGKQRSERRGGRGSSGGYDDNARVRG